MSMPNISYPFGFILSKTKLENVPSYYEHQEILNKFHYYRDPKSKSTLYNISNTFLLIHGHHTYLGEEDTNFLEKLFADYKTDYNTFLDKLDLIAGRYVIIIYDGDNLKIYPDATASRTTYYSLKSNIISSHVHLINDVIPHHFNDDTDKLNLLGITWDLSPYEDIKSIIPNMYVNITTSEKVRFFPRKYNKYKNYSLQSKLKFMEISWEKLLNYYISNYKQTVLSLTGGEDSRFSLAMSKKFLPEIELFTYTVEEGVDFDNELFKRVTSMDKKIVDQILSDIHLNHQYIYFDNKRPLYEELRTTLEKNRIVNHLPFLIPYYKKLFKPREEVIHLRSSIFGLARAHYDISKRKSSIEEINKSFLYSFNKFKDIIEAENIQIDKVFDYGIDSLQYKSNLYDYHLLDIYFWESRIGRWMPETINESDLFFDTLNTFNARAFIDLSLSFNYIERKKGLLFQELINRNYPILNFYGKNKNENLYEEIRGSSIFDEQYFDDFKFCSNKTDYVKYPNNGDNSIYVPFEHAEKGTYSEVTIEFSKENGYAEVEILNKYINKNAKNYYYYEVLYNDKSILSEDISLWNNSNKIAIYNLKLGDLITIRMNCMKSSKSISWEKASRLFILDYQEYSDKKVAPKKIKCSSPHSQLRNI